MFVAPSDASALSRPTNCLPPIVAPTQRKAPGDKDVPPDAIRLPRLLPPAPAKVETPIGPVLSLFSPNPLKPNCTPNVADKLVLTSATIVSIMTCARRISSLLITLCKLASVSGSAVMMIELLASSA